MEDRNKYIAKMSARLKILNADIKKLEAKADLVKIDAKANYRKQVKDIKNKRDEAQKKIKQIQKSSEEAWVELKTGFEKSWNTLSDSVKNTLAQFK
jgi:multidrug resistance efflux pump